MNLFKESGFEQLKLLKEERKFWNQLIDVLRRYFNSDDLKLIYFKIFEELPMQNSKNLLILELIENTKNHQRSSELIKLIKKERPNIDFDYLILNINTNLTEEFQDNSDGLMSNRKKVSKNTGYNIQPKLLKKQKLIPLMLIGILSFSVIYYFSQVKKQFYIKEVFMEQTAKERATIDYVNFEYRSKNDIVYSKKLKNGSVLYTGDHYRIQYRLKETGYVYVYQWTDYKNENFEVFDIMVLFSEIHKANEGEEYIIPSTGEIKEITLSRDNPFNPLVTIKETICFIALKRRNDYLEKKNLVVDEEKEGLVKQIGLIKGKSLIYFLNKICPEQYKITFLHKTNTISE